MKRYPQLRLSLEGPEAHKEPPQIDHSKGEKVFINESKNSLGARAGIILKIPEGAILEHYLRLNFSATNNETEYKTFIAGLSSSYKLKVPACF